MTVLNVVGWVALAISAGIAWYTHRCLDRSIQSLDVSLAAFDAALVARAEACEARDKAVYERKATLALLEETRRIMGPLGSRTSDTSCPPQEPK